MGKIRILTIPLIALIIVSCNNVQNPVKVVTQNRNKVVSAAG
jgi:hypothetical protein